MSEFNEEKKIEEVETSEVENDVEVVENIEEVNDENTKSIQIENDESKNEVEEKDVDNSTSVKTIAILGCVLGVALILIIVLLFSQFGGTSNKKVDGRVENIVVSNTLAKDVEETFVETEVKTAKQIYAENVNSVVAVQTNIITQNVYGQFINGAVAGSGFIITETGYIVTNYHVVEDAKSITATLVDGREYDCELIGYEEENDIAVLKIKAEDGVFSPVIFGVSENMSVGEDIVLIGNPLGEKTYSMTKGIISALDRTITFSSSSSVNLFQVDAAVNEGASGGPAFNMNGEVLGIITAKYSSNGYTSASIEGIGFCIPIDDVKDIISDIMVNGKAINKAYMGVTAVDVLEEVQEYYKVPKGAYVYEVLPGSAGEKSGLKVGDVIVKFNDTKIESAQDLITAKKKFKVGETATLTIYRGGKEITVDVVFTSYEENYGEEKEQVEKKESIQDFYNNYFNNRSNNNYEYNYPNDGIGGFNIEDFFNIFGGY